MTPFTSFVRPSAWLWILRIPLVVFASIIVPAPISVDTSQRFEGNDGPWSTFPLQVGTPAQEVRVLIAMAGQQTWVVAPDGCTAAGEPSNCPTLRGGIFNFNTS